MTPIETMLNLIGGPRDTALLRFLLATEYLKSGDTHNAIKHLRASIDKNPDDAIAWKMLGDAQARARQPDDALESYRRGIVLAVSKGDQHAAKEMEVSASVIEQHGV